MVNGVIVNSKGKLCLGNKYILESFIGYRLSVRRGSVYLIEDISCGSKMDDLRTRMPNLDFLPLSLCYRNCLQNQHAGNQIIRHTHAGTIYFNACVFGHFYTTMTEGFPL